MKKGHRSFAADDLVIPLSRLKRSAGSIRPQKCAEIPLGCKNNNHFPNIAVHSCGLLSFKFRLQYTRILWNCQPSFFHIKDNYSFAAIGGALKGIAGKSRLERVKRRKAMGEKRRSSAWNDPLEKC